MVCINSVFLSCAHVPPVPSDPRADGLLPPAEQPRERRDGRARHEPTGRGCGADVRQHPRRRGPERAGLVAQPGTHPGHHQEPVGVVRNLPRREQCQGVQGGRLGRVPGLRGDVEHGAAGRAEPRLIVGGKELQDG
jgi:hypothetical protein